MTRFFSPEPRWICLTFLLLSTMTLMPGCSDEQEKGPRSVLDSISQMEQAKKVLDNPYAVTAPVHPVEPDDDAPIAVPHVGTYKVKFEASTGDFVVLVHRDWAPVGAQRFYELVKTGFYDECRFFRVMEGFMVQFGISGDPATQDKWERRLRDDKVKESNKRGFITFATSGKDSRTTQVFINFVDNARLDTMGFAPFGEVVEGMDNVDKIYAGYGESPQQPLITSRGNAYLNSSFPDLDYIKKATIVEE